MKLRLKALPIFVLLSPLFLANMNVSAQEPEVPIIPQPQDAIFFDAAFRIDSLTTIVLSDDAADADSFLVDLLSRAIAKKTGTRPNIANESEVSRWQNCILLGDPDRSKKAKEFAQSLTPASLMELEDEGYFLQISDSLTVVLANSAAGLFYGCQTLIQLLRNDNGEATLTGATIYDWPSLRFRGVSLDLSKGDVPNLDALKDFVRFISTNKMNMLMLYLGNVFAYSNHPRIAEGRAVLTSEESAELTQFAREHHVEIVPMVETLSNLEEILRRPEYRDLAEFPGSSTLKPLSEDSYQLMSEIIEEIANAFDSSYMHIGGSAAHEVGRHQSRAVVERAGLDAVLAQHYKRVGEIISGFDKQFMMASGILMAHPRILHYLPEDLIISDVTRPHPADESRDQEPNQFVRNSIVSPVLSSGCSVFPDYFAVLPHIKAVILRGVAAGAKGAVAAQWSTAGNPTLLEPLQCGFAFAAACAWSPNQVDLQDFRQAYFARFGRNRQNMELIYSLLSDMSGRTQWWELRRHPFLAESSFSGDALTGASRLSVHVTQAGSLLDSLPAQGPVEQQHVAYIRFAAQFGSLLATRVTTAYAIKSLRPQLETPPDANDAGGLVGKCLMLLEDLNQVAESLHCLRASSYKTNGQMPDLAIFDLQAAYWQEIMRQIQIGRFGESPILGNDWIRHPPIADSGVPGHAFFRKTFEVMRGFKTAYLQATAESHLKIYLNGAFVDEVIGGPRTSLAAEEAVKMWDMTSVLRPGKNVIAVEAWNYYPGAAAAINVYGEIVYELGRTEAIHSNEYWKTSTQSEHNWQTLGFFDVQWLNAHIQSDAPTLIKPDFQTGRASQLVQPSAALILK